MSCSSSPDPLALSMSSSTANRRATSARKSTYMTSSSKSMYLEPENDENQSPWRIKLTVQAEPVSPAINRSVRTTRVPLKDADGPDAVRRSTRRSVRPSSSSANKSPRKPTPSRRRNSSVQTHDLIQISEDATNDYSLSEIDSHDTPMSTSNKCEIPIINSTAVDKSQPASTSAHTSPGFPHEHLSEDERDDAAVGADAPGEATVLESEEFSMISVDSLSSNPRASDHLSLATLSAPSHQGKSSKSVDVSWLPSSPPTYLPAYRRTPYVSDTPPSYPAAPAHHPLHHEKIETPFQESAKKSGRALQSVVTGPFRTSISGYKESSSQDATLSGFSAGTRRQLRESLNAGQNVATPQMNSQPNFGLALQGVPHFAAPIPTFSSPFQSPVRRHSGSASHQLPTPIEHHAKSEVQASPEINSQSQSPDTAGRHVEQSFSVAGSRRDDAIVVNSAEPEHELSPHEATTPQPETFEEEDEASKDIWQEEASRSIDDDETPPIMREDLLIKPRISKLPRTWRGTSEARFSHSDSPEPGDMTNRKISAATSASGIMTPPGTEDEQRYESSTPSKSVEEEHRDEVANRRSRSPALSDHSAVSSDGEDSGRFWQSNLPAVFNCSSRPAARRARTERPATRDQQVGSSPQADASFAPSSPLTNTLLEISPLTAEKRRPRIPAIKRNPQSDSVLMPSPLKQSLLRTSKLRGTPAGSLRGEQPQNSASETIQTEDLSSTNHDDSIASGTSSSMASDARQLHNELHDNGVVDLTNASSSGESELMTETDVSQSYVEELNRDSPMKVRVNFNDSFSQEARNDGSHDAHGGSSLLSSKKQYPALFGNEPSHDSSKQDVSTNPSQQTRVRRGGFVSRLTDSFWEAVTAPAPYVDAKPTIVVSPSVSPAPSDNQKAGSTDQSVSPSVPDHVLRLRRKYGLLPNIHPFTYQHVRTLHRMLNSARLRGTNSSIIPSSGSLPEELQDLVGRTRMNDLDQTFTWTPKYAHVVASFMSLLLSESERQRLVDHTGREWGDEEALKYKRVDSKGRRGSDVVYRVQVSGAIESLWIAGIVEDIVWKEEMNLKKKKVQDMLARAERVGSR